MSATNKTTYYELPIFIGTDTPSWLGDWNNTMDKIDTAINGVNTKAQSAANTANTASGKADANTESITAMQTEIQTLKTAVQNYDNILNFNPVNLAINPNNCADGSAAYIVQNANKTLNKIWFSATFKNPMSNPTTYTYTRESGTGTWYDLFTVEDNVFNLNQTSLPTYKNVLTVGSALSFNAQTMESAYFLRAWFDGATTHFGIDTNRIPTDLQGDYITGNYAVFLSGSVYNPDDPSAD